MSKKAKRTMIVGTIRIKSDSVAGTMLQSMFDTANMSATEAVKLLAESVYAEQQKIGSGLAHFTSQFAPAVRKLEIEREAKRAVKDITGMSNAAMKKILSDTLRARAPVTAKRSPRKTRAEVAAKVEGEKTDAQAP